MPTTKDVTRAIHLTGGKLQHMLQANGQFQYRFHIRSDVRYKPKYNMLRHAGSVYALGQYHDFGHEPELVSNIRDAVQFMKSCCVKSLPDQDATVLWMLRTKDTQDDDFQQAAKLGGAGLGLVAAVTAVNKKQPVFSTSELAGLGNFILFMQKADGSFYSKYFEDTATRDEKWTSLYYPGEAALGLLFLNGVVPDTKWLMGAKKALLYLARSRKGKSNVPADHWALIATQRLLNDVPELTDTTRRMLVAHAVQISEEILSQQQKDSHSRAYGAFDRYGKTTPAATRIEGLVAAYKLLPDSQKKLKKRIYQAVEKGVAFLLKTQIKKGPHAGAIPRALLTMPKEGFDAKKFNQRRREVRIDYLQHALCAMIGWLEIQEISTSEKK
ncbi:MAG: hypothetical protein JXR76_27455 [Deltaproteobacteria bacterium]|nr:hypothetical protein [Deltaproteobacteria bacterium]